MTEYRNDERVRAWLVAREPGPVPDTLRASVARTPYEVRRPIGAGLRARIAGLPLVGSARRIDDMNPIARAAMGVAAVAVVAVVGINLLPRAGGGVGGPAASPSPSPLPSPSLAPSPSAGADVWPKGTLEAGQLNVTLLGIPFSFDIPSPDWLSRDTGEVQTGSFPTSNYAWLVFGGPNTEISTDPCTGKSKPIGASLAEQATALTTIPGTDAVGPTDVTVGGHPAKLVVLTIHDDIPCATNKFWLYGEPSLYPNALTSTIRIWIVGVDDKVLFIHSDQAGPNAEVEQQIQQIVDSIRFE